jgi:cell division initiation protein
VKISPLDIKRQEFAVKFRGYSPDEVHAYLEMVAAELEDVSRRNLELEQKVNALEERVASYTRMETLLKETLVNTQRTAEETKAMAEKKAEALINDARLKVDKLQAETRERLVNIQREITDLKNQRDSFIVSFKSLLETQSALLEQIERREMTRQEQATEYTPIRKKADLSDEELDKVVDEFERKLANDKKNEKRF